VNIDEVDTVVDNTDTAEVDIVEDGIVVVVDIEIVVVEHSDVVVEIDIVVETDLDCIPVAQARARTDNQ